MSTLTKIFELRFKKNSYILHGFLIIISLLIISCNDETELTNKSQFFQQHTIDLQKDNIVASIHPVPVSGAGVMMQAFYWNVPSGGTWWDTISTKIEGWSKAGINATWLPPVSKAQGGSTSMGYDPFDYFDFGEYNQMGTIETRFGSRTELQNLIDKAHSYKVSIIADIVLNHNSGGKKENNPYTGTQTWSGFFPISGKFNRTYADFHPNDYHNKDSGIFGGFSDLCHHKDNVQNWLWKQNNSIAKYYKDTMGFDGWRFDYVKGFEPWVVKEWLKNVGGFSIGEYWESNVDKLDRWVNEANSSAFDFACYYAMNDAFDGDDLTQLNRDMLWKRNPKKTATFVTNHDTNEIWDKTLAYAYILTHEGYPTLFYTDYEKWLNKKQLNNLIWIHNNLASGTTTILYTDNDEYVARRNGYKGPGLIVYLNDSNYWQERWIPTNWSNKRIKDYTGHSNWEPVTQNGTWVKIQAPPHSYTVWSLK